MRFSQRFKWIYIYIIMLISFKVALIDLDLCGFAWIFRNLRGFSGFTWIFLDLLDRFTWILYGLRTFVTEFAYSLNKNPCNMITAHEFLKTC